MPEYTHSQPLRAVIYARYSSDKQKDASIEDQIELCRRYIERQNWTLLTVYEDRAMSGANDHRPGYRQMIADAETHQIDVIVCESLDRLGRRLTDISSLYDRLEFAGVKLHAANIGQLTPMHIGMLGTMAQLYLSDLKEKTRRGQMGLVREGKVPEGKAYGYDLVEGKPGERQVNKSQAMMIRRIFKEYVSGKSPRAIAKGLNAAGIPGPEGGEWQDTTIRGQPSGALEF